MNQFHLKTELLCHGCSIDPSLPLPGTIRTKKIHLYSHSHEKAGFELPDDLLLSSDCIVRIRLRTSSPFSLIHQDGIYAIFDQRTGSSTPVEFLNEPNFSKSSIGSDSVNSICASLGKDLLGIAPSNYCFYFSDGKQCKFCEILPTFKKEVSYKKSFKPVDLIQKAILQALESDPSFCHLAITTGNIKSYDYTLTYLASILESIKTHPLFERVQDRLATLMPPEDVAQIALLKQAGYNKVYFPLEVYNPDLFATVCPGKKEYGYDKILQALEYSVGLFGPGNVFTNFVYGIQSLDSSLDPSTHSPERERELSLQAVEGMLARKVIPSFTLYHYGGYNRIGAIQLDAESTHQFFCEWGKRVKASQLVPSSRRAVLFGSLSLSNTLFNDGYLAALDS